MPRSKKWLGGGLGFALLACVGMIAVAADTLPDVLVFYREGCEDCRQMDDVLDELQALYPSLVVTHIEESDPGAADLMWSLSAKYGIFPSDYPVIFVGDHGITGIGLNKELLLRRAVRECVFHGCESPLGRTAETPFPWVTLATVLVGVLVLGILLMP